MKNNEQLKKIESIDALNKISSRSNNIKAELKFKYLTYKLERSSFLNKFIF